MKMYLKMALFMMLSLSSLSAAYAAPFAYIPNTLSDNVSVIDLATNTVVATIPVGSQPSGIGITPEGSRIYVANSSAGTLSVIDAAARTVIATVPVGLLPSGVAVAPNGRRVYVTNYESATVSVIDTATNTVVATLPVDNNPNGIAVRPDSARLYVTHSFNLARNEFSNTVSVINTLTNTVIASVQVGDNPRGIAVTHDGTRVYVANRSDDSVSVIDTATNTVTATLDRSTGLGFIQPVGVAITPDDSKVYVTNNTNTPQDGFVSVIDTATNIVTNEIYLAGSAFIGISFTADGTQAYVGTSASDDVSLIDTATERFSHLVTVGNSPTAFGIFIAPNLPASPGSLQFNTASYTVAENAGTATISVTRTGDTSSAVSVRYATSNGTALAGSDYSARSGTLSFAAGEAGPKRFFIPLINDSSPEANETVRLTLSNATGGATLGTPRSAVLTITNDDTPASVSANFNSPDFFISEDGGRAIIRVNRIGGPDAAFSINYSTRNGTALAGSDYIATFGTLTFTKGGPNSLFFSVPILNDTRWEPGELVNLTLSNPTNGAVLSSKSTATLRIINDDGR